VSPLPKPFADWFSQRGWSPRPHQLELIEKVRARRSTLLIAPTGAGKTLAGFLPSLIALHDRPKANSGERNLHTLYISPLKALATDVHRNLMKPVEEMGLPITIETRTGDTPVAKRARQRQRPPDILLTTPEQIALLIATPHADAFFGSLDTIILDELHSFTGSKRGDLMALDLARLRAFAPDVVMLGLSATVARPSELRGYLVPQSAGAEMIALSDMVRIVGGAEPDITILEGDDPLPWSGHSCRYAMPRVYEAIKGARLTLIFVNTRSQAEIAFQELWRINDENLPIALHHGSLEVGQRRKVEAAMAEGKIKAVVATSTLDLGIDWGDVDLVVTLGAPKGASRLIQRVGRANHRMDEPSRAIMVPANRFEVLECRAALDAAKAGAHDAQQSRTGALDVLAQHIWGAAVGGPFHPDELYREVASALPYAGLSRRDFDRAVDFVSTGGYALRAYDRFARLKLMEDGRLRLAHPSLAQTYRMNVGTIVESPMVKVRLVGRGKLLAANKANGQPGKPATLMGGRVLGEMEEWFMDQLAVGDTFIFAGEMLRFEGLRGTDAFVSRSNAKDPKIPSYQGGKFPLSTHLAERVRAMLDQPETWAGLPLPVAQWLHLQKERSELPGRDSVLVETFPRADRNYLVAYPFEGRLAHQTLGMLLTRRLDRAGANPLGFVANDYALSIWCLGDLNGMIADGRLDMARLFDQDMLGDDLEAWLAESFLMKRTFRYCAVIAGLVERRHPGKEKSGRQITFSTDLIYDVLRQHDAKHILLEAAWNDAATGLLDIARLSDFLGRIDGKLKHRALERVSPLSVPVLLEIGKEPVLGGGGRDALLKIAEDELIREATGQV
jgi:ATP-dependent helicase Lhr and Lhr-like helicase